MENKFLSIDWLNLYYRSWFTSQSPKGVICIIHGLGEHSGRYDHLAKGFNTAGYNVFALDLRGHGKSEGKRGHTPSFDHWMSDIDLFMKEIRQKCPTCIFHLYGHSLGGNLALNYLLRYPPAIKSAIISSPALELAFKPNTFKVILAKLIKSIFPSLTMATKLNTNHLSKDSDIIEKYNKDPLVHDRLSVSAFTNMINGGKFALNQVDKLIIPTLLMHGLEDKITDHKATQKFAKQNSNTCKIKLWAKDFHELHNDSNKKQVLEFILSFIAGN
jgi:alpha-beta hydrolase superfamily lysophospholipase